MKSVSKLKFYLFLMNWFLFFGFLSIIFSLIYNVILFFPIFLFILIIILLKDFIDDKIRYFK